ncbi:mrc1-like domain-containing protein [Stemphylium lycopersici]|nr:mrc1-like domain-containing protein [Stemphylium lycopersici]
MGSRQQSPAVAATASMRSSPGRAVDASAKPRAKLLAALRKPAADSSESEAESENGSSASEDEAPVPAAIPNPLTTTRAQLDTDQPGQEEESDGEDAYELMKKRLAASKNSEATQSAPQQAQQEAPIVATVESSEDEDAMPVRANGRKSIAVRTKTATPRASPTPSAPSRPASPGLFVTPDPSPAKNRSRPLADAGSDSESSQPTHTADVQERVQRIRQERLAKQQEAEAQQTKPKKSIRRRADEGSGSDSDGESGRRLTQQAKPTRRAGKKAMEAMARDQQRISRNMQLTHQAKTKKRFTTQDLFKKFNFQVPNADVAALPTPEPSSALASSDAEANQVHQTPPTSPSRHEDGSDKQPTPRVQQTSAPIPEAQDGLDSLESTKVDKGKGRAPEFQHLLEHPWMKQKEAVTMQNASVDTKDASGDAMVELSDSDDDQGTQKPKSRFPVFDRLPTKKQHEAGSLVHLRALAQLTRSPPKAKKGQKSVTRGEMEMLLAQKARQQTAKAREERIADLIKRGHNPETEEEREKRQVEIDDMVALLEKQRQEDLALAKMERKEAKKNGETIDDLPSSDEEDGDYIGSGEEDANQDEDENQEEEEEEAEVELSGSEDEEAEGSQADNANGPIDGMADEDEETAQAPHVEEDVNMEDDDVDVPGRRQTVNRARNRVIDDDDESDTETVKNATPTQPATPDDAMAAFGFGNANTGVGLTQMFAGTMAELESESQPVAAAEPEQDSLDFLRNLPETQPGANFSQASDFMVPNSQSLMSPQKVSQTGPESQFSLGISQVVKTSPTLSRTQPDDFEPTQDAGFSFSRSPAGLAPPPSTVDTVMMAVAESPIKEKKGKLQRGRREAAVELSDVEEDLINAGEEESEDDIQRPPKPSKDAFRKMQQAVKKAKAAEEFNKKNSMAREAVMEQAEESEDEYAGLGGASDDEEGEEDEDLKDMIDHNDVKVDERQIAAFYADKTKKDDEKQLAELYKKMQSKGGLRRNAGGYDGFDMSDSEDEAEMRQRRKRAAFQKQTNALLQDQKVKALADDDKKKAFFNTLADFADEGEYDYLNMPEKEADENSSESQSQSQNQGDDIAIPDSQNPTAASSSPLKRKAQDSQKENRPPPNMRRTAASDTLSRKPLTADDVKHSISELIEDPRVVIPDSQLSDTEEDYEDEQTHSAKPSSYRKPIIDRLTLSRQSTVEESVVSAESSLAFHNPARAAAGPGFRVPSLIRQATSNLSVSSERSSGGAAASAQKEVGVRRGGTGRSNIHAQAREAERRQLLEKKEVKRKEALRKKVEGGRKKGMRSVLSDLGGGFE